MPDPPGPDDPGAPNQDPGQNPAPPPPPPGYPGAYPPPPPGFGPPGYPGPPPLPGWGPPGYGQPAPSPSGSPLAHWGLRAVGWIIDLVITSVIGTLVLTPIHAIHQTGTAAQSNAAFGVTITRQGALLVVLIVLIYTTAFIGSSRGQTIGMMVVGVKAVDGLTGAPIGHARALGRGVFEYLMVVLLFPWVIDMLFPLWDPRRQTLHDKVAKTIVVKVARR